MPSPPCAGIPTHQTFFTFSPPRAVIKIKLDADTRRVKMEGMDLFAGLLANVRATFSLAPGAAVRISYKDADGDVVTIANVRFGGSK